MTARTTFRTAWVQGLAGLAAGLALLAVPAEGAAADRVVKISVSTPEGHPYNIGMQELERVAEAESDGALDVQIFPSAQLGGEVESVKNVQLGTMEAALASTSNISNFYDRFQVFSVPYLFNSTECAFHVLDGEIGDQMAQELRENADLRLLGWVTFGARHLFNTKRRVTSVEDLEGLKIRAPDKLLEKTWATLGANPTPLPFPEVFNALQQGVIDGDANPLTSFVGFKWYEVVPYVSKTNTAIGIGAVVTNESYFQSLPEEQQQALLAGGEAGMVRNWEVERQKAQEAEAFLKDEGIVFDEPDLAEFREKLSPVIDDAKADFGAELVETIRAKQQGGC